MVKTIGDAVMATFPTPDRAIAAALRMRDAMRELNEQHGREDLLLKIGVHEGPCIAVAMNERQDYFGQTVNIASRVQGLANFAVDLRHRRRSSTTARRQTCCCSKALTPQSQSVSLRGIEREVPVYAIPLEYLRAGGNRLAEGVGEDHVAMRRARLGQRHVHEGRGDAHHGEAAHERRLRLEQVEAADAVDHRRLVLDGRGRCR